MKLLFGIVVILFFSFSVSCQNTTKSIILRVTKPLSQNDLITSVLKQLNLNKDNCKKEFICIQNIDTNKSIVVIPEIVEEDEHYLEMNSHILIVDRKTGVIETKYFESSKTNLWVSDAVEITKIEIDTTIYLLKDNTFSFGLIVFYRGQSHANPYDYQTLSLYNNDGNSLNKVLNNLITKVFSGVWDTDCVGEFIDETKTITILKTQINKFSTIKVATEILSTVNYVNNLGDCDFNSKTKNEVNILQYHKNKYIEK